MPAGQGNDAERFAAVVELGTPPGAVDDAELARELEIVAMLRSRGAAYAPDPEAKARAKQRLMAVLAADHARPRHAASTPTAATELTLPMGRVPELASARAESDVSATEETTRIAPVATGQDAAPADDRSEPERPGKARPGRTRRGAKHTAVSRPSGQAAGSRRPGPPSLRRRALVVGAAALVAMVTIAGGAIFASNNALPGDSLYAIKRAAESAGVALAIDDAAKARNHLEMAETRLSEVEQLAARDGQTGLPADVAADAIKQFETSTGEGARLLLTSAESGGDRAAVDELRRWADKQAARLSELKPSLPPTADADSSLRLLDRVIGRTEALSTRSACGSTISGTDDLGPVPVGGSCGVRDATSVAPDSTAMTTPGGGDEDSATGRPDSDRSTAPGQKDKASKTPTGTPDEDKPGLLPDLRPQDVLPGNGKGEDSDEDAKSTTETKKPSDGSGDVPVPLIPPITLPPLLPGMPGITIG